MSRYDVVGSSIDDLLKLNETKFRYSLILWPDGAKFGSYS